MSVFSFSNLTQFIPPAGNLEFKDRFISIVASFLSILAVAICTAYFSPNSPMLLASMGASVVILVFAPFSPFAQPWSFVVGQLVSAFVGITCTLYVTPFWLASSLAVSLSILAMLFCIHQPQQPR